MANEPQSFDDLYPGRFLKAGNFHGKKVTLTIEAVSIETLEGEKGKQDKAIVTFKETPRQLVLCKLNGTCIKGMFGGNVMNWKGKRVTFFPTDTIMPMPSKRGDDRICIRVWGSPDIAADLAVEFAPPRRKAFTIPMHAVKRDGSPAQPSPAPQKPAEAPAVQDAELSADKPEVAAQGQQEGARGECSDCGNVKPLQAGKCYECTPQDSAY